MENVLSFWVGGGHEQVDHSLHTPTVGERAERQTLLSADHLCAGTRSLLSLGPFIPGSSIIKANHVLSLSTFLQMPLKLSFP